MAAPLHRVTTMLAAATSTTRKVSLASAKAGDYIEVAIELNQKGTAISPPSADWKEVAAQKEQAVETERHALFYLANYDEAKHGKEVTFTWGGASKSNRGEISIWSGCDPVSPVAAVSNAQLKENTPKSKSAVCDAVTTTTKENVLRTVVFNNEGATATPAAGWTELGDQADGPEVANKTAAVEPGVQAAVTHTLSIASLAITVQYALQPPQTASVRRRFVSVG